MSAETSSTTPSEGEPEVPIEEERDDAVIGQALRVSAIIVLLLICVGGAVAWSLRPEPTPPPPAAPTVTRADVRTDEKVSLPQVPLVDITAEAGIDFRHETGADGRKLLPETMGSGCAFFDYDSDGDPDLLLVNSQPWPDSRSAGSSRPTPRLYENNGAGQFTDVTAQAGLDITLYGMGCAAGDFDNDGDPDLYLTAVGPNRLLRNDGGRFVDVTEEYGAAGDAEDWGTSCGWFDYDNDADLDLFVCNYVTWSPEIDLAQDFTLEGVGRAYGRPTNFDGTYNTLFRNDGDRLTDVSAPAGIRITNPDSGGPVAKSLGVAFADFDRDGYLDLFVANDTVQDFLFHNSTDGTFEEVGRAWGVAFDSQGMARGGMGVDIACFRPGEPCLGISIGNFANEMTGLYVSLPGPQATFFTPEEVANGLGPNTRLQLTFGVLFVDVDLDGRPDLFTTNGHLEQEISKVQESQTYEQPPQLFWNAGVDLETEFVPMGPEQLGEEFFEPLVGRGSATADVDGDGDLDLLMTGSGGPPRLLRNDQQLGHHWIRFDLADPDGQRDAIGSRIDLVTPDGVRRSATVSPTRSYLSQSERSVTFGLGEQESVESVEITWPDGDVTTLKSPEIDRLHRIEREHSAETSASNR